MAEVTYYLARRYIYLTAVTYNLNVVTSKLSYFYFSWHPWASTKSSALDCECTSWFLILCPITYRINHTHGFYVRNLTRTCIQWTHWSLVIPYGVKELALHFSGNSLIKSSQKCWHSVNWKLRNKVHEHFTKERTHTKENAFENVILKMTAILFRP